MFALPTSQPVGRFAVSAWFYEDWESIVALPKLTPEERAVALQRAAKARAVRAEIKQQLKSGSVSLSSVIKKGESDDAVGKLRVVALLEALPGVGRVRAQALLEEIGIAESRRVRGLGPRQTAALVERFG